MKEDNTIIRETPIDSLIVRSKVLHVPRSIATKFTICPISDGNVPVREFNSLVRT
jgi:hypothetical protein